MKADAGSGTEKARAKARASTRQIVGWIKWGISDPSVRRSNCCASSKCRGSLLRRTCLATTERRCCPGRNLQAGCSSLKGRANCCPATGTGRCSFLNCPDWNSASSRGREQRSACRSRSNDLATASNQLRTAHWSRLLPESTRGKNRRPRHWARDPRCRATTAKMIRIALLRRVECAHKPSADRCL